MNKRVKDALREAERAGFTTKDGAAHVKVYDPTGKLVITLAHGQNRDRVPGGCGRKLLKLVRERGTS